MKIIFILLISVLICSCIPSSNPPKQIKGTEYRSPIGNIIYKHEKLDVCSDVKEDFSKETGYVIFFFPRYFERIDYTSFNPKLKTINQDMSKTIASNYINKDYIPGIKSYINNATVFKQEFKNYNEKWVYYFSMKTPNSSSTIGGNGKRFNQCRSMVAYVKPNGVYVFTLATDYKDDNEFEETEKLNESRLQEFFEAVEIE